MMYMRIDITPVGGYTEVFWEDINLRDTINSP